MMLDVTDVHTYYGNSHVLEGVSVDVDRGETVTLVGRNGVGKTTLLRTILQLTPPRSGSVRHDGDDITGFQTYEVSRRRVGWVPEDRRVFSQLSVEENLRVSMPTDDDVRSGLESAYEAFPILQDRSEQIAGTLSGGQQQMLAIARALVGDNDLLLIDEPSEGLAPQIVETVASSLEDIAQDTSIFIIEQNLELAMEIADRYYVMDNGQIVDHGATDGIGPDDLKAHLGV